MTRFSRIAIMGVWVLALRLPAQVTTGEITGTVTDSANAVISGATVTATNSATNTQRTATTSGAGVYNLTALPPGTYSLRVEMQGFTSQVRSNIELQVAQAARFDISLQVGNVTEVVEVQAGAQLIETDNSSLEFDLGNVLTMHGGDVIKVSIVDTPDGLKVVLEDVTTGQSGSMIAGIAQGFGQVNFQPSSSACSITPYAFHPMYDTSSEHYLDASNSTTGPLFRPVNRHGRMGSNGLSADAVAFVVKRYAVAAGFDVAKYAGHSLRAGLATSAAAAGVSERSIMNQTGHKSAAMVRRYIRNGSLFSENAAAGVGL